MGLRLAVALLALGVAAILVIVATADAREHHRCTPNVSTTERAHSRAQRGWDSERVKKRPRTIARVRLQARCVPDGAPEAFVEGRIAEARRQYRQARKEERIDALYRRLTNPPGRARLAVLRQCESTNRYNDPAAPAGAYGMLQGWALTEGWYRDSGWPRMADDPPDSPPYTAGRREQDIRASLLYQHYGAGPWECPF